MKIMRFQPTKINMITLKINIFKRKFKSNKKNKLFVIK